MEDENEGLYCDNCDQGPPDVEIYHHCTTLGTICQDCYDSGEFEDYWEQD